LEIINDTVTDLLADNPTPETTTVEQGQDGPFVAGATVAPIRDVLEFHALLQTGFRNRTSENSEYGPMQPRATSLVTIGVTQDLARGKSKSSLTFVVLPGSEKLLYEVAELRLREGSVNKELLGVSSLLMAMSSAKNVDFAPYNACKTAQLLEEVLGGNYETTCIVTIAHGNPDHSIVTAKYTPCPQHHDSSLHHYTAHTC
jgi:hypothetical protein